MNLGAPEELAVPVYITCDTRRVTVKQHEHHLIWKSCLSLNNTSSCDHITYVYTRYIEIKETDKIRLVF
jgi:hypothetical protein